MEKQREETSKIVDLLTSSGKHALDPEGLKKLKKLCRTSDDLLKYCHYLLVLRLQQDDANVRYSALVVVDELFRRSHLFRTLVLDDLQTFLELVLETNADLPLPAPVSAARELKKKAAHIVGCWQDQFGASYRVLALAANFLKHCKQIPLGSDTTAAESQAQRSYAERLLNEIAERTPEAEALLTQLENCLKLIVPPIDDDSDRVQDTSGPSTEANRSSDLSAHGMGPTFTLQVSLEPHVIASGDNAVLLQTLAEQRRELTTIFLPRVKRWLRSLAKVTHSRAAEVLRRTVHLKQRLEAAHSKCNELHVQQAASSDEEDLEEVPEKEGLEPVIPAHRRAEYGLEPLVPSATFSRYVAKQWSLCDLEEEASDPTSRQAQLHKLAQKLATSSTSVLQPSTAEGCNLEEPVAVAGPSTVVLSAADGPGKTTVPRRHYDIDLYHWEDEKLEPPTLGRTDDLHHVWVGYSHREASDATVPEDWRAALRERRIDFSGEFVPIKWMCRAPLPSGKLCPRQDRYKCPFHGPIVPRNSMGQPEGEAASGLQRGQKEGGCPDWQEPGLLRDLEAATGVNLEVGRQKKRKRKKAAMPDNPRKRLEKKVFNKRSVRRVADAMDSIDSRKFDDKFGNQWNYAFNA